MARATSTPAAATAATEEVQLTPEPPVATQGATEARHQDEPDRVITELCGPLLAALEGKPAQREQVYNAFKNSRQPAAQLTRV